METSNNLVEEIQKLRVVLATFATTQIVLTIVFVFLVAQLVIQ